MQGSNSYSSGNQRLPAATPPAGALFTTPASFNAWADVDATPPPVDFRVQVAASPPPPGVPRFDMRQLSISYAKKSVPNSPSNDIGKLYIGSTELYSGSKVNLDIGGGVNFRWKPRKVMKEGELAVVTIEWKCTYGSSSLYAPCGRNFAILESGWAALGLPGWLVSYST